jgi:methylated-DNA-[protein]-cysteine S-methyltransferase
MKTERTRGPGSRTHLLIDSPIGSLLLSAEGGTLVGIEFPITKGKARGGPPMDSVEATAPFDAVRRQLDEYFAGRRRSFKLPFEPRGTDFRRKVWAELVRIPFGETITYGELARRIGQPTASRAVGLANGANPIPIVVPCHRVIGAGGALTGFGGGLDTKRFLLDLETAAG